jgi:hypothetical protein
MVATNSRALIKERAMKYYIYISDTKVDMLYPQIPKPVLKKIASNLSIDLKLFGAEVSVASKSSPSDETRYAKVRIVSEYIEKNLDVGSVDAPSTYFKGNLPMRWGPVHEGPGAGLYTGAVYFGGYTNRTVIGIGGSGINLIGSVSGSSPVPTYRLMSGLPSLLQVLGNDPELNRKDATQEGALEIIEKATHNLNGTTQQLEFLAKTLLQGRIFETFRNEAYVVLGTPIYVALAD